MRHGGEMELQTLTKLARLFFHSCKADLRNSAGVTFFQLHLFRLSGESQEWRVKRSTNEVQNEVGGELSLVQTN